MPESVLGAIWNVAGILVPSVAALGFGFAAMTPPSFRAARVCLCASAAWLALSAAAWSFLSPLPLAVRGAASVPAIIGAGFGLILCLRWVAGREVVSSGNDTQRGNSPRRRAQVLAAQLRRFVAERYAGDPDSAEEHARHLLRVIDNSFPGVGTTQLDTWQRERDQRLRAYTSETMDRYDQKFAEQVIGARDAFMANGYSSQQLEPLATYPTDVNAVARIAETLTALAKEQPTALRPRAIARKLRPEQQGLISRTIMELIPNKDERAKRRVQVVAIGSDRETRAYAADFANALIDNCISNATE